MPSNLAHSSYTSQETSFRAIKGNTSEPDTKRVWRLLSKLSNQDLVILKLVGVHNGITAREIRDKISLGETAVLRRLRDLWKQGWVERKRAGIGGGQLGPPPFLFVLSNKAQVEDISAVIAEKQRDGDTALSHLDKQVFEPITWTENGKDLKDELEQLPDANKQLQLTDISNQEDLPFSLNSDEQPLAEETSEEEPIGLQTDTANTTETPPHLLDDNDTGLTTELMRDTSSNATIKEMVKVFDKVLSSVFNQEGVVVEIEKRLEARVDRQNIKISMSISNDIEHSKSR